MRKMEYGTCRYKISAAKYEEEKWARSAKENGLRRGYGSECKSTIDLASKKKKLGGEERSPGNTWERNRSVLTIPSVIEENCGRMGEGRVGKENDVPPTK